MGERCGITDTARQGRAGTAHGRASRQEQVSGDKPRSVASVPALHHPASCFYPVAGKIPCPKAVLPLLAGLAAHEEPALSPSRPPALCLPTAAPDLAPRAGSAALPNLPVPPASKLGQLCEHWSRGWWCWAAEKPTAGPATGVQEPRLSTHPPHDIPSAHTHDVKSLLLTPLPAALAPYPCSQLRGTARCALERIHRKGTASSPQGPARRDAAGRG